MHRTLLVLAVGMSSCGSNVLHLKNKPNFSEQSVLTSDSVPTAYQQVCYNERRVIDEEYCYYVRLRFQDTTALRPGTVLDLERDTALVRASYGVSSVWNWSTEENSVKGTIEVLQWHHDEVKLKERIQVDDRRRQESVRFRGTRTFRPASGW